MRPEEGLLYYFKIEVVEQNGKPVVGADGQHVFIRIATTRPEQYLAIQP